MTNTAINKAIRNIIGVPYTKTYTDRRKNGHRAKFHTCATTKRQAQKLLSKVNAYLQANKIARTAQVYRSDVHWDGTHWSNPYYITTFTK